MFIQFSIAKLLLVLILITEGNSKHKHREEDFLKPYKAGKLHSQIEFSCLKWTPWISADNPTQSGDWETLSSPDDMGVPGTIQRYIKDVKVCTIPVLIQCRNRPGNVSWTELHDELHVPCQKTRGLVCRTEDQLYERICWNYEVRFLCWTNCPHLEWSHWIDNDNPDEEGDIEILGETIPREHWPCAGGEIPVDVECETITGIPTQQSKKRGLRCSTMGFSCINALQGSKCQCDDFKVRFLCPLQDTFPNNYKHAPLHL